MKPSESEIHSPRQKRPPVVSRIQSTIFHRLAPKSNEPEDATSADDSKLSDEEIDVLYSDVLDSLLFPPHVKEQLLATQTRDKKSQTIHLQKSLLHDMNLSKTALWGVEQQELLETIKNSKTPEIQLFIQLRSSLSTANRDFMRHFFESGGLIVLMKCVDERASKPNKNDHDAAMLYEIMCCFKMIMNNAAGLENFITQEGSIECTARALLFDWKPLALQVQ